MTHRPPLARPLLTAALLALLTACGSAPPAPSAAPTARPGQLSYEGGSLDYASARGDCLIRLQGEINNGTTARLSQALNELGRAGCTRKSLELDATQGVLGSAITVGSMLRNRGFDVAVKPGSTCLTPCWLVLAAGKERTVPVSGAALPARIGLSQVPPDQDYGRQTCQTDMPRNQALTLTRYLRAMLPDAAATAMFQRLVSADCNSIRYLSGTEALALGLATRVQN